MSSKRKLNYNDNKNNNKYYYTYSYYSNNNKQQQQRLRLAPQSNNNNNSIKLSACSPMEIYEWQQITTTRTATTGGDGAGSLQVEGGGVGGLHHAGSFKTLQSQMFWFEWFADSQESFLSLSTFLWLS